MFLIIVYQSILFYCNLDFGHDYAERSTYSLVWAFFTDGLMLTLIMVFIVVVMTLFPAPKLQNTLKPQHSHHCVCGNLSCLSFSLSNAQIFPLTHLSRSPVSRRCWMANFKKNWRAEASCFLTQVD